MRILIAHEDDPRGLAEALGSPLPPSEDCSMLATPGISFAAESGIEWATNRRPSARPDGRIEIGDGFFAVRMP